MSAHRQPTLEGVRDAFQEDLKALHHPNAYVLPDVTSQINHDGKYVRAQGFEEQGIYFDSNPQAQQLAIDGASYAFQAQPGNRLTREDSHNVVFFGRLWATPPHDGTERHAQVAVKSMEHGRRENLIGELAMFQYLHQVGLPTFKPAAMVVGEHTSHLLTHFEGPVTTMDTVEWEEYEPEEAWVEVDKVADTLCMLHEKFLFHGDAEFRNIAFNERNEIVIVDPELMTSAKNIGEKLFNMGMQPNTEEQLALGALTRLMSRDFSAASKSIREQIVNRYPKKQRPRNDEARLKIYRQHLFEPYKARLYDLEDPVKTVLLRTYDEMYQKKKALAKTDTL